MPTQHSALVPWASQSPSVIPAGAEPPQILQFAGGLRPTDADKVAKLFLSNDYDVAAEFIWRRGMSKMRSSLAALGMRFVGEMLGRSDIDETSSPDRALTEHDTIRLAEQLGFVSPTGAFRLQQAFDILAHFSSQRADDVISRSEAITVLRGCVQYLLREPEIGMAVDFANLRNRLLSETIATDDIQLRQLMDSPPFFLGTTVRVLLAGIKGETGARVEHAIRNLYQVLPQVWTRLPEQERWNVGVTYAEVSVAGNTPAVSGLKHALHLVAGFDYVPENLRSNSYRRAAQAVLDAHFGMNNFYNEYQPTSQLASMGSSIPRPALAECVQAFLCVYVGNCYGAAFNAAPTAYDQLKKLTAESWQYYLTKILQADSAVLGEIQSEKPAVRFSHVIRDLNLLSLVTPSAPTFSLIHGAFNSRTDIVRSQAEHLWKVLKTNS